ncbi:MAG: transposase [Gammaproteobacteria bacterium]|nr:transposase [Gammaproteobacteria bacterium]
MARRARMYLPGHAYHVYQRGNNHEACFNESENYRFYLELWDECSRRYGVAVHAYCLMTNHVHFLVTPEKQDSISRVTRDVGSRYAFYFNRRYQRTGTLWEGRHKASLVQCERYFLACSRYIELNPVAAGMVENPEAYPWSSYLANAWGQQSRLVQHDEYLRLGRDSRYRCFAYRELFRQRLSDSDIHAIEKANHYCQPVGDSRFRQGIERKYGIKLGQSARGRPRKGGKVVKK